jgi:ubiquinone/menaquinone biosynthesis C-methylase UbiE
MTFKDHFSGHAVDYAAARPTYPEALFDWLAAQCPRHELAWDAGCGNGQASLALATRFRRVHASDPSDAQIAAAPADPRIAWRVEPAERCSLPDGSADLATVAQAFHWFDHGRYLAEVRRVVRAGGLVALWTYGLSSVDPAVDAVFADLYDGALGPYWPPERRHVESGYRDLPFPFAEVATPRFAMACDWTLAQYLAYLASWSASRRHLAATGLDAVAAAAPAMAVAWGDPGRARTVSWPLSLRVGRVGAGT